MLVRPALAVASSFALAALAACAGFAACASSAQHGGSSPPAIRSERPSPRRVTHDVPSRIVVVPASDGARIVGQDSEGAVFATAGGYRIRVGTRTERAREALAETIEFAIPRGVEWRFFTATCAYDAPTFLGALRRVDLPPGHVGHGVGRPVFVDEHGSLRGADGPMHRRVIDGAFSDDRRGVLVVEPGRAMITQDTGLHWTAVTSHDDAALGVVAEQDARWVIGAEAAVRIDRDGSATELPLERVPAPVEQMPMEVLRTVRASVDADPLAVLDTARGSGVTSSVREGERVWFSAASGSFVFDLARDSIVSVDPTGLPCVPTRWLSAGRTWVVCPPALGRVRVFARAANDRFEPWLSVDSNTTWGPRADGCVASDDGEHIACPGTCADERGDAGAVARFEHPMCSRSGVRPPRTSDTGGDVWIGLDGERPIRIAHAEGSRAAVVANGPGELRAIAGLAPAAAEFERVARAEVGPGSRARWIAPDPDAPSDAPAWVIASGPIDGTMHVSPSFGGSTPPTLGEPQHVLALRSDGTIAQTDDDGEHWQWLHAADSWVERWLAPSARAAIPRGPACAGAVCTLRPGVIRFGFGPPQRSSVGAEDLPPDDVHTATPQRFTCEPTGSALALHVWDAVRLPDRVLNTFESPAGVLDVEERRLPRAEDGVRVTVRWRGLADRSHDIAGAARSAAFARLFAPDTTSWRLIDGRAQEAWMLRCSVPPGAREQRCDLLLGSSRGLQVVSSMGIADLVTVADRGRFVALASEPGGQHSDARVGSSRAGSVARGRFVVWNERLRTATVTPVAFGTSVRPSVGVYIRDGDSGTARLHPDGRIVLSPSDPRIDPIIVTVSHGPCGASVSGRVALSVEGDLRGALAGGTAVHGSADFALDGDRACLRSIRGVVQDLRGRDHWLSATAGADGIVGTAHLEVGALPIRCSWPAATAPRAP